MRLRPNSTSDSCETRFDGPDNTAPREFRSYQTCYPGLHGPPAAEDGWKRRGPASTSRQ
ncbi:hypothetical protein [Corynebacterium matruchotii]|uniref:hypothetical protein n=1 Tax=Corynebacterium matruchotii TaxID=43768 RepID=UPI0028E9C103|nr:hypothetical protein [Corynebacterium matruchotii]